jgi:L,D-peptidoglycan transpeptidase YkuD (ErfK/YbiS/YcfS/YnhG family)
MRRLLAAGIVLGAVVAGLGVVRAMSADAAAVPPYHPTKLAKVADSRQVVVVVGKSRGSSYSTVYTYQLGADGKTWTAKFPAMAARNGYAGWAWAGQRIQDSGTTPMGTFRITQTFGLKNSPGTKLPWTHADGNDYWVGDNKDAKTYNMFQSRASSTRTWRTGEAERLSAYPTQYEFVAVIDYNRPPPSSITWDAAHGQHVTSKPADVRRGSAIFLHVKGSGSTAGCVSLSRSDMVRVLQWLDPAQVPRIVMAPTADLGRL